MFTFTLPLFLLFNSA
jgi:cutinase